jgi:hypothetical protein
MLAWYLRLGEVDMRSTCDDEADIDRETMSGWQDGTIIREIGL